MSKGSWKADEAASLGREGGAAGKQAPASLPCPVMELRLPRTMCPSVCLFPVVHAQCLPAAQRAFSRSGQHRLPEQEHRDCRVSATSAQGRGMWGRWGRNACRNDRVNEQRKQTIPVRPSTGLKTAGVCVWLCSTFLCHMEPLPLFSVSQTRDFSA